MADDMGISYRDMELLNNKHPIGGKFICAMLNSTCMLVMSDCFTRIYVNMYTFVFQQYSSDTCWHYKAN